MEYTQRYMKIKPHERVLKWQIKKKKGGWEEIQAKPGVHLSALHQTVCFDHTCELSPLTETGRRECTGPLGPIFETSCESIIILK